MNRALAGFMVAAALGFVGCSEPKEEASQESTEEALRTARADSVAQAMAMYDPTVFDTLTWESDNARWERGGVVWAFTCQRCHGADGTGNGPDPVEFDFTVPDVTAADWQFADDLPAIRERIFVGHETEMPSMGLIGLPYSDVDAAAHYVNDLLRAND